jgi:hypothetical protein
MIRIMSEEFLPKFQKRDAGITTTTSMKEQQAREGADPNRKLNQDVEILGWVPLAQLAISNQATTGTR